MRWPRYDSIYITAKQNLLYQHACMLWVEPNPRVGAPMMGTWWTSATVYLRLVSTPTVIGYSMPILSSIPAWWADDGPGIKWTETRVIEAPKEVRPLFPSWILWGLLREWVMNSNDFPILNWINIHFIFMQNQKSATTVYWYYYYYYYYYYYFDRYRPVSIEFQTRELSTPTVLEFT